GALAAELRRAEANHHDIDQLLPRLVRARGFGDADDVASVIHHRLARATARPAGSGRNRKAPCLITGLIPYADGPMSQDMRDALDERHRLIEARAEAVLDTALQDNEPWTSTLGPVPNDASSKRLWRPRARVIAADRDRYAITDTTPLGASPDSPAQKIDRTRAEAALRALNTEPSPAPQWRPAQRITPERGL